MRPRLLALVGIVLAAVVAAAPGDHASAGPAAEPVTAVDARIERVWPDDAQGNYVPVATAPLVDVEVYLFQRGTLSPVACSFSNQVTLRWAQNGTSHVGLATLISPRGVGALLPAHDAYVQTASSAETNGVVGQKVVRTGNGLSFPAWDFNDVPVEPYEQIGGTATTYFTVEVAGVDYRTNVWAHGSDPRTLLPIPVVPVGGTTDTQPNIVDTLIAIVWPHDRHGQLEPVTLAPLVNVGVDLAQHPADMGHSRWTSIGFNFGHTVRLYRALNNGFLDPVPTQPTVTVQRGSVGGTTITWPRYEFDDVDVSAGQDPANTYYFAAYVDGITTHPTIWAHGAGARTHIPSPDIPAASGTGC